MDKTMHIIITHNPQDFFQDIEPRELTIQYDSSYVSSETINDLISGGYSVIITNTTKKLGKEV